MPRALTTSRISPTISRATGRWITALLMVVFAVLVLAISNPAPRGTEFNSDTATTIIDWHGNSGRMAR